MAHASTILQGMGQISKQKSMSRQESFKKQYAISILGKLLETIRNSNSGTQKKLPSQNLSDKNDLLFVNRWS